MGDFPAGDMPATARDAPPALPGEVNTVTDAPFDCFVILAEMRTGSNFLEANINEFASLRCLGEAFNPVFIAHGGQTELYGVTMEQREADPLVLLRRMREQCDGLPGFRFFHDHDPRVLAHCLADRRCAKVVLTRNPLESYVSLRDRRQDRPVEADRHEASALGQGAVRSARVRDPSRTDPGLPDPDHARAADQRARRRSTSITRTSPDVEVLNGLAQFLGTDERIGALSKKLKKQNPEPTAAKVVNAAEMEAALARLDRFNLSRTPNFEPRRGPSVPGFHAGDTAGLLYMPMVCGPEAQVLDWLERIGGGLVGGFTQKALRQWMRHHRAHRSFTVLRHPVARAHAAFCRDVLGPDKAPLRAQLARGYKLPLPEDPGDPGYDLHAHRRAFFAFLGFLKGNLAGQTGVRVAPAWASQSAVLQGYAQFSGPDAVLREERLAEGLAWLAAEIGLEAPELAPAAEPAPFALSDVYDDEIEAAAREAYQRDYLALGYGPWGP